MLRDHLEQRPDTLGEHRLLVNDYQPSAVLTLFLTHIYLQYKINQMVDADQRAHGEDTAVPEGSGLLSV